MTDRKTIVITWTDRRGWEKTYGKPLAALYAAEGTDATLNNALAYIASFRDDSYRVHTFATDDAEWKSKAIEAHANGRSL